jgi:putative SOS response-associated peptidase YedK
MCGRIALYTDPDRMARILQAGLADRPFDDWQPSWNVAPTRTIFGVSESNGRRILDRYRWGLVPSWVKDPKTVRSTFNARAESLASKPMFRSAFESRRILIPVDEFYEWETLGPKLKQPYAFRRSDGAPIVLAGLQEWHPDVEGGQWRTATIITTAAGPDMPIHDRQPAVLEQDVWDHWLDVEVTDRHELESLLRPTAGGTLVHHPVRKDVGNVENDGPELVEALALEGDLGQTSLFPEQVGSVIAEPRPAAPRR